LADVSKRLRALPVVVLGVDSAFICGSLEIEMRAISLFTPQKPGLLSIQSLFGLLEISLFVLNLLLL